MGYAMIRQDFENHGFSKSCLPMKKPEIILSIFYSVRRSGLAVV